MFGLTKYTGGGGGGGNVTTSGLAAGALPIATAPANIENSPLTYIALPAPGNFVMPGDNRLSLGGLISNSAGVPLVTVGPAAGLGGTATMIRGNDMAGLVAVTFGNAGLVPGALFTLTFLHAYATQYKAVICVPATGLPPAANNRAIPYCFQDIATGPTSFVVNIDASVGYNLAVIYFAYIVIG